MIGAYIVFGVAVAIVVSYIFTVNRFLRSDKNWTEPTAAGPQPKGVEPTLPRRLVTAHA